MKIPIKLVVTKVNQEIEVTEPRKHEKQEVIKETLVEPNELKSMVKEKKIEGIKPHEVELVRSKTQILLVTANEFEHDAVLAFLEPTEGDALLKYQHTWKIGFMIKHALYIFGRFGPFNAAVQMMEKQGSAAAQDAVTVASQCFGKNLYAIFAVGVACGVEAKSKLLDVLVSTKITSYNLTRYGTSKEGKPDIRSRAMTNLDTDQHFAQLFRAPPSWPPINSSIVNRLAEPPVMRMGLFLSGDFLIDNKDHKEQLLNNFAKEAIGIEMEGAGLFHEYAQHNCKIMIVKSVSDFGDGGKDKRYQPTAALLAADCLKHYLCNDSMPDNLHSKKGNGYS